MQTSRFNTERVKMYGRPYGFSLNDFNNLWNYGDIKEDGGG
jgi:hypothetical protein